MAGKSGKKQEGEEEKLTDYSKQLTVYYCPTTFPYTRYGGRPCPPATGKMPVAPYFQKSSSTFFTIIKAGSKRTGEVRL